MKKEKRDKPQQISMFEKEMKAELEKMNKIVDFLKHKEKRDAKEFYSRVDKMLSHLSKRKLK